ncbi:MAG: cation-transporting P-type ATPase [Akkermansiaceae bacterium]|nr:cation-transporting P-type ATPase [Akkermansiaceae bacterium]
MTSLSPDTHDPTRPWHASSPEEAIAELQTDPVHGLAPEEAARRLEVFGPNRLTARKGQSAIVRLLLQFHQPLIYILLAAGITTAVLGEYVDSGVIFGVVLVNAVVGYLQEARAARAIDALARSVVSEAVVVRGGEPRQIPADGIVPGDLILLQSGQKVPADLRLSRSRDLQIDESALTGESVPSGKTTDPLPPDTLLADRSNCAYASTLVTYGQGRGIVMATGEHTEVGRISELIGEAEQLQTPLTRRIAGFSHTLLIIILVLAGLTFGVGVLRGEPLVDMFMAAVALAVGAIPEGLPAAVTIILAIGVSRMAKRRAIIRRLPAVETLGSTTVVCSDKTGTLTENQMTVREIRAGGRHWTVEGTGYDPAGRLVPGDAAGEDIPSEALVDTLRCGTLCNDSILVQEDGLWAAEGDPTEGALLTSAHKGGIRQGETADALPRVDTIPFESQYQYMATLHATPGESGAIAYVKGALEALLPRCTDVLGSDGTRSPLDGAAVTQAADAMAAKGLRVLAFARKSLDAGRTVLDHADLDAGLTFLGLQAMIDPARPAAIAAIRSCQDAGIRVKMITGDHVRTAAAIAGAIGLRPPPESGLDEPEALSGRDLMALGEREFRDAARRASVFARVTPEQKLRLVQAMQAGDEIVAMTGDGVNDAPALKQANIGIAMGGKGTDVAREACDMVLTDDNFETIAAAVEEGRSVFDNLTKFIVWTLPTNVGEGLVILAAVFAGAALPILPVQILWINMTTGVLLGMTLAFEPTEKGLMLRPPRHPKDPLLTRSLMGRIAIVSALMLAGAFGLFQWQLAAGAPEPVARTVAVNVFVMIEMCYLFNCRSLQKTMFAVGLFTNRWLLGGVAAMLGLQLLFTYLPAMNHFFQSAPIPAGAWPGIVAAGLSAYVLVGIEKWLRRRSAKAPLRPES